MAFDTILYLVVILLAVSTLVGVLCGKIAETEMAHCLPTTHCFRLVHVEEMGPADAHDWTPVCLIRQCRQCPVTEAWHGSWHPGLGHHRVSAWDMWDSDGGGDRLPWKKEG